MKGYFKTKDTEVFLRTKNFKLKEVLWFFFFSLNVVQKLVFLFPCFCTVTSASVHLPGKWEG